MKYQALKQKLHLQWITKTQTSVNLYYLATNDINLEALDILKEYSKRWPIEVFHRDIKKYSLDIRRVSTIKIVNTLILFTPFPLL